MINPDNETDNEEGINTDFGSVLAASRKSKNYSIDDVCAHLKIPPRIIDAIENSDVAALPEVTFTQGYIRSYAKFLEISEENVLAIYKRTASHDTSQKLKPCSNLPNEANSKSPLMKTVTLLLILAAFSAIIYGAFQYYQNKADVIETERESKYRGFAGDSLALPSDVPLNIHGLNIEQQARLSESGELIVQQAALTEKAEIIAMEESVVDAEVVNNTDAALEVIDEALVLVTGAASSEESVPEEEKDIAPRLDVLKIYAEQGSWMQVHDASTSRLLYNMIPKGGEKTILGQAPFRVSLGNAKTTKLVINDVAIDISKHIRANNIASFTVSTEGQRIIFHQ